MFFQISYYALIIRFGLKKKVQALINFGSKVNVMTSVSAFKLDLTMRQTNTRAQKIDNFTLETFEIVLASFWVGDKLKRVRFFQDIFLLTDINIKVVLGILFLTFRNPNIYFAKKKLIQIFYTKAKASPNIKQIELIHRKEFAKIVLDENVEAFIVQMTSLNLRKLKMSIHPPRKTQITLLFAKKLKIPAEYLDFSDVFPGEKALVLLELIKLNQYAIKLQDSQQPSFRPIYRLGPIKSKTLKTYIKTNLANGFICRYKSIVSVFIPFVQKLDSSFCFYINYQDLHNLTIQNLYPFPLIGGSLDQ